MVTNLYRLRIGGQIVGYRKHVGSYVFFSRDDFWYNGAPFHFETEDAFTLVKDRRGHKLFVGDVVRCMLDGTPKTLRIVAMGQNGPEFCCHISESKITAANPDALLTESHFISLAY
jgi:hypothetical protein